MKIHVPEEIFSIKSYTGTVESNDNVATFIKFLRFNIDKGESLKFKAGGYIQISVPVGTYDFKEFDIEDQYKEDWNKLNLWRYKTLVDQPIFRAYSMANHPAEGNKISLTIRIATPPPRMPDVNPGQCSSYVFSLKKGDKIDFSGSYGEFFYEGYSKRNDLHWRRCWNGSNEKSYIPLIPYFKNIKKSYLFLWCKVSARKFF
jgi:Na+-transporting NADH:ubiquinone oxidoreductase subunit F